MNSNYNEIGRLILLRIQQLSQRLNNINDLTWTKFRLIEEKLDLSLLGLLADLVCEREITDAQINQYIFNNELDEYITQIENGNYSKEENYDEELDSIVRNIEESFTNYLNNCTGAYYVGTNNFNNILNKYPLVIANIGYRAMNEYRNKYIWIDGYPIYSLDNLPPFYVKEFIPDIMQEIQKSDSINSLMINYSKCLTELFIHLLFNQSQSVLNYIDNFFESNNFNSLYKTIYFALPDGSSLEYNHDKKRVILTNENGISCRINPSFIAYHKKNEEGYSIENINLYQDKHMNNILPNYNEYNGFLIFLKNFERNLPGLTITLTKTGQIDNLLEKPISKPVHK